VAARFRVFKSGGWHDVVKVRLYTGGAWVEVLRMRLFRTVGLTHGWKDVYIKAGTTPTPTPAPTPTPTPAPSVTLSLTATPSSVSGTRVGQGVVYTNGTAVTAKRGTPPYTYRFTRSIYSGSVVPGILIGATPNQAQFSRNMAGPVPETETARFKCVATDSVGNKGQCFIDATFLTTALAGTGGDGTINGPAAGSGGPNPLERPPGGIQPSY
jgi:hypothetical protein